MGDSWRYLDLGRQGPFENAATMPVLVRSVAQGGEPIVQTSVWGATHLNVGWFDDVDAMVSGMNSPENDACVVDISGFLARVTLAVQLGIPLYGCDPDVRPDILARGTPGFSGADLANLVNEAALFAARANKRLVDMDDFERAKDKIFMGAERKSMVISEEERVMTAYHESGHAVVAKLLPRVDPVHKVTIVPRGRALGLTWMLPERDSLGIDREKMLQNISMALGGRIAEEVFMNRMTTGASSDFENATRTAREMVTRYGMSDALGTMVYGENEGEVFLGRSITTHKNLSEATMQKVDGEIRRIIDEQYSVARKLIEDNRDKMHAMAKALLEWETIDAEQLDDIMAGKEPRPPKDFTPRTPSSGGGGGSGGSPVTDPAPTAA